MSVDATGRPPAEEPVLWHITTSPYSEKARWALDHKRVPHRLRAPLPGAHIPIALWLTRGRSFQWLREMFRRHRRPGVA